MCLQKKVQQGLHASDGEPSSCRAAQFLYDFESRNIADAMRCDTVAPSFWSSAFRDSFRQEALAGLCLPILWLIMFDLGRSLADLVRTLLVFVGLRKTFTNMCPKKVSQDNNWLTSVPVVSRSIRSRASGPVVQGICEWP